MSTSRERSALLLLALVTALVAELVRASGPLLDRAFAQGPGVGTATALVTYVAPAAVVAVLTLGRAVSGRVVLAGVAVLVGARLALQASGAHLAVEPVTAGLGSVRHLGGLATVALGLGVLVLVAAFVSGHRPGDPAAAGAGLPAADGGTPPARGLAVARGVTLGLLGSAAVNLALGAQDAVWRGDRLGWVATGALTAGALLAAWRLRAAPAAPGARGLWVLGPFVALGVQVWANPAFVASQTGFSLTVAACALAVAALAAGVALSLVRPAVGPLLTGAAFVIGVWLLFLTVHPVEDPPPWWAAGLLVVATALPAVGARLLAVGLSRTARPQAGWRLTCVAGAAGLTAAVPLLVCRLAGDVALPFPEGLVPVAVAVAVATPSVVRARHLPVVRTPGAPALTGAVTALAVVGAVVVAGAADDGAGAQRGVSWPCSTRAASLMVPDSDG